jgi:hypothetical protein
MLKIVEQGFHRTVSMEKIEEKIWEYGHRATEIIQL